MMTECSTGAPEWSTPRFAKKRNLAPGCYLWTLIHYTELHGYRKGVRKPDVVMAVSSVCRKGHVRHIFHAAEEKL